MEERSYRESGSNRISLIVASMEMLNLEKEKLNRRLTQVNNQYEAKFQELKVALTEDHLSSLTHDLKNIVNNSINSK